MSLLELSELFNNRLDKINKKQNSKISDNCLKYLSELLIANMHCEFLNKGNSKYLFELYKKSIESVEKNQKINNYKYLGDYSLIVSGYFSESIETKMGFQYYIEMGSSAYWETSIHINLNLFRELALSYVECMCILNELAIQDRNSSKDFLKTYENWLVNQSEFTKNKLLKLGMSPWEIKE